MLEVSQRHKYDSKEEKINYGAHNKEEGKRHEEKTKRSNAEVELGPERPEPEGASEGFGGRTSLLPTIAP